METFGWKLSNPNFSNGRFQIEAFKTFKSKLSIGNFKPITRTNSKVDKANGKSNGRTNGKTIKLTVGQTANGKANSRTNT